MVAFNAEDKTLDVLAAMEFASEHRKYEQRFSTTTAKDNTGRQHHCLQLQIFLYSTKDNH